MKNQQSDRPRIIRPKGSFPSLQDEILLVQSVSEPRHHRKTMSQFVSHSVKNIKSHVTGKKVRGRWGSNNVNNRISFDNTFSKDSDIREEEVSLMDYVDGTYQI